MASEPAFNIETLFQQMGRKGDGALTFEEAVHLTAGNKLDGPIPKPIKKDRRDVEPDLKLGDMPMKLPTGTKLTKFCDVSLNVQVDLDEEGTTKYFDNLFDICYSNCTQI